MKSKKIVVWIQKNAFRILCACLLLLCIPMAQQSFRHNELSGGNLQGENYSNPIVKDQEIHILFSPRSAQLSSIQFRLVDVGGGDENADVT
ncbi:hypothetical protein, partial [uncultured Ruthenibacterium sp.]|uniref:hypothetical protein n=1 Tax=uncultured Ruthenibacterium sp. TaxID=1905347 RepID=UPI00349EFBBB